MDQLVVSAEELKAFACTTARLIDESEVRVTLKRKCFRRVIEDVSMIWLPVKKTGQDTNLLDRFAVYG